jgi:hypothetical protein
MSSSRSSNPTLAVIRIIVAVALGVFCYLWLFEIAKEPYLVKFRVFVSILIGAIVQLVAPTPRFLCAGGSLLAALVLKPSSSVLGVGAILDISIGLVGSSVVAIMLSPKDPDR